MFIYFGIIDGKEIHFLNTTFVIFAFVYYVISGLRRLIQFNIEADAGTVGKYFVGIPTPLGAILLWIVYLGWIYEIIPNENIVLSFMVLIGFLLNSKIKIPHP
jgi:CDP-diacylglycerol--serine O-phosphatidyltransferase